MSLAGKLNKRITIQVPVIVQDEDGLTQESWQDHAVVWAAVEPLRGREYFAAAAVNAENTVRFRIRYQRGINSKMRLVYDGRVFNLKSPPIDPEERHVELHLMCVEEVGVVGS